MLFKAIVATALAGFAAAQFGGSCFDAGDCLIQGGGDCQKSGIAIVGTCVTGTAGGFALPTGLALPTGFSLPSFGKREAEE